MSLKDKISTVTSQHVFFAGGEVIDFCSKRAES